MKAQRPDPSEDEARRLLSEELAKPEYNQPESLINRLISWVLDQIAELLRVLPGSSSLSALLIIGVVAICVAGAFFASRRRLRDQTLRAQSAQSVLEEEGLSARDYRARAAQALAAGDWDAALLDSYRALTASAGERTLLDQTPSRTAHEVSMQLAPAFPTFAQRLSAAADAFDRVRYGEQACDRQAAEEVQELDADVLRARPETAWAQGHEATWARL
ncbi:MAG: DUF4129 domain-containing protein [Ornithinimicrobium sp.]